MSARLKVLLSAYACEPNKGSEPEVGWRWAMQMARFHDVTVLTRANNQTSIDAGLRALPPDQPRPRFIYFDGGPFALWLKKKFGALHLYYVFWQRSARAVVADLVRRGDYDLLHHVTFAGYRFDTAIFGHGVPAIWGPLGGMESIPMRLLPWRHPFTLAVEILRNAHNTLQSTPFHVLPDRAAKSSLILVSTKETQQAFARLKIDTALFPTIGIEREAISLRALPVPQGTLEILFVGRLLALKGLELALQALKQSQTNARFTIVGDGPFLHELKSLARRLDLESRVVFRGRLTRQEILGMLPQFHVFLFPSLHDSGAFAVLEAMANGLPVICLDCGGPAISVADGCGIRVPPDSRREVIAALAAAIRSYDTNREMICKHGEAARTFVAENYEWNRKGERLAEMYDRVFANEHAPAAADRKAAFSRSGRLFWAPATTDAAAPAQRRRFALSTKGVVVTAMLCLLIGITQFCVLQVLKRQMASIVLDTLPGLSFAGSAISKMSESSYRLRLCTYSDNPANRKTYRAEMDALTRQAAENFNRYQRLVSDTEERRIFTRVIENRDRYLQTRDRIFQLLDENKTQEAIMYYQAQVLPAYQPYKRAVDELFAYNVKQGQERGESAVAICRITQIAMVLLGLALFATGFLLGFFK